MSARMRMHRLAGRFGTTEDTKFHIDYGWWERSRLDHRLYLYQQLCEECRQRFPSYVGTEAVDWVDPDTGEVRKADALTECLRTICAHQADFINESLPLTSACFRVFLTNHNVPLSPRELSELFDQTVPATSAQWTARKILRVLNGTRVYLGLRPVA